jgi:hypothetical protein
VVEVAQAQKLHKAVVQHLFQELHPQVLLEQQVVFQRGLDKEVHRQLEAQEEYRVVHLELP